MDFLVTILYLWLTLFLECGAPEEHRISKRLVGSDEVRSINEFPFIASIQYLRSNPLEPSDHFCGGAIISEYWVLSVAQCFASDRRVRNWVVRVGDLNPFKGSSHQVNKIIVHPRFEQRVAYLGVYITNDLGVARVKTSFFRHNRNVRPIAIGRVPDKSEIRVQTAGWGFTKDADIVWNKDFFAKRLRKLPLRIVDSRRCAKIHTAVTQSELCAISDVGRSTCKGDAGNPLITLNPKRLVGVAITYRLSDCRGQFPVFFVRLSYFIHWLRSVTKLRLPLY